MTISNYSTTDTQNNDAVPNGAPDGMLPSDVIDLFRRQMADQRAQWNNAQWFDYLDGTKSGVASYVASNQFKITGNDATAHYHVGRRVKVSDGSGTVYGSITATTYGAGATTVTLDTTLTSPVSAVYTSVLSSNNDALPREAIQDIVGAMLTGNTTSAIDVTYQDSDGTIDFEVTSTATDNNFSNAYKTKLDGIADSANNYSHPTTAGNKHIPTGGSSGQLLQYSASGTAQWWTPDYATSSHTHSNYITSDATDTATGIYTFSNGQNATTSTNGTIRVTGGIGLTGNIVAAGNVTAYYTSDRNLKTDIVPIDNALDRLNLLSGNSFYFKKPQNDAEREKQYGVIAQEVQTVMPEMVSKNDDGTLVLKQAGFELTALLIEAVKELSIKVNELEQRL